MSVSSAVKTVRVGVVSSISKIDPRDSADHVSALVLAQIFETPYLGGEGGTGATPCLFEPLKQESLDALQYSAAVRPGIRFSEGTPLTADIAARSLRSAGVLAKRAAVEVRGDRVWFTLTARNPRFELTLAQSGCSIVLDKGLQFQWRSWREACCRLRCGAPRRRPPPIRARRPGSSKRAVARARG
jgi:hypothetical protein